MTIVTTFENKKNILQDGTFKKCTGSFVFLNSFPCGQKVPVFIQKHLFRAALGAKGVGFPCFSVFEGNFLMAVGRAGDKLPSWINIGSG